MFTVCKGSIRRKISDIYQSLKDIYQIMIMYHIRHIYAMKISKIWHKQWWLWWAGRNTNTGFCPSGFIPRKLELMMMRMEAMIISQFHPNFTISYWTCWKEMKNTRWLTKENNDIVMNINMEIQFGERVGHGGWLIGLKLFRTEAYPPCVSSKLCEFI